jgi:hypothetical protein
MVILRVTSSVTSAHRSGTQLGVRVHAVVRPNSPCVSVISFGGRHLPQHRLYFFPLLHGHGALRPVPGYFSLCVRGAVPRDASRGMFGNISRCRLIIGTTSDSQKSANSAAFILSAGRIWARLSSRSVSGSTARFQHS